MSLDNRPEAREPMRSAEDAAAWFRGRERPVEAWKVGIEHEKIGLLAGTTEPIPYEGPQGIATLLESLARFGYTPFLEDGRPIAATREGITISLEPGGQLELSGRPFKDVHVVAAEFDRHIEELKTLSSDMGLTFLAAGYRPWGTPASMPWMPKARYGVMRPFLKSVGRYAEDMMAMTATVQASFDWGSEADLADKVTVALLVQPALAALYANSPIVRGAPSGWQSYRLNVWTDVGGPRCGAAYALAPDFAERPIRRYAEWALDLPMIFVRRGPKYLPAGGMTFRDFIARGLEGETATVQDWEDHLTTLFPPIRVKGVIEVRAADSSDAAMTKALPAFWKGILYCRIARGEARELLKELTVEDALASMGQAARLGLRGKVADGRSLAELATELVAIASRGLCRQDACGEAGEDERVWLEPLAGRAASGRTPADESLEAFASGGEAALVEKLRIA
jgi:glutamate--cysteine ligase